MKIASIFSKEPFLRYRQVYFHLFHMFAVLHEGEYLGNFHDQRS